MLTIRPYAPCLFACAVLLVGFIVEMSVILWINNGVFTFSLDDPYIHLAVAKNLLTGHYGINPLEAAAPSSSILWPLLVSPLGGFHHADFLVAVLNLLLGFWMLWVFHLFLQKLILKENLRLLLLSGFVLFANMLGLIFIGMEHQLQALTALLLIYGMFLHVTTLKVPGWIWPVIVIAPLVRYESLALSAATLFYLFFTGDRIKSLITALMTGLCLAGFSFYLLSMGLSFLPDSVLVKSGGVVDGNDIFVMRGARNILYPKAWVLLFIACLFFHTAWFSYVEKPVRLFYAAVGGAIVLHLLFGQTGWLFRYEIYMWVFAGCALLFLCARPVLYKEGPWGKRFIQGIAGLCLFVGLTEHLLATALVPLTANNIYSQQYQMGLLVRDYIKEPVGVNDLGLVALMNETYTLDLWGLGSSEARRLRQAGGSEWMQALADRRNVRLVMIYHVDQWFKTVPLQWEKIGELQLKGLKVTSRHPVSFFVTDKDYREEIGKKILAFTPKLPENAHFSFSGEHQGK